MKKHYQIIYKYKKGRKAADEVKNKEAAEYNAEFIFKELNNYLLDGMPCDRVNEIVVMEDNNVTWKRKICVHKDIWEGEGISINVFYELRNEWIKAFVKEINEEFAYKIIDDNTFTIEKI